MALCHWLWEVWSTRGFLWGLHLLGPEITYTLMGQEPYSRRWCQNTGLVSDRVSWQQGRAAAAPGSDVAWKACLGLLLSNWLPKKIFFAGSLWAENGNTTRSRMSRGGRPAFLWELGRHPGMAWLGHSWVGRTWWPGGTQVSRVAKNREGPGPGQMMGLLGKCVL